MDAVTAVLHSAGALALWDYATAAPYVQVDMNPVASGANDQVSGANDQMCKANDQRTLISGDQ